MEISFKDIFNIIKKNIVFIVAVAIIAAMLSFFYTNFFVTKTYTATVKLYVSTNYNTSSGSENINNYNYAQKLVATYIELLNTNSFFADVSENLNEKFTPSQLDAMVSFTSIEDTEVFKATVTSSSPTDAKLIADAVAKTAPQTMDKFIKTSAQLKIVDSATVPKAPTSPNVSKSVLIAFFAGLVIALVISFIRDYFDVKVKYDEDMTTLCNVPVLAAIPDFEDFTNGKSQPLTSIDKK